MFYRAITYILYKNEILNKTDIFYKTYFNDLYLKVSGNNLDEIIFQNEKISSNLYNKDVIDNIHFVSNNAIIRNYVTKMQRSLAENKNIICEGRDIGTVVFPDAKFKFYLDANIKIRVDRRYDQFMKNNISIDKHEIKKMILNRDNNDKSQQ